MISLLLLPILCIATLLLSAGTLTTLSVLAALKKGGKA